MILRGISDGLRLMNMRAQGTVWENHFTKVVTDTSAGGKRITEATPNTGVGFATFPLCEPSTRSKPSAATLHLAALTYNMFLSMCLLCLCAGIPVSADSVLGSCGCFAVHAKNNIAGRYILFLVLDFRDNNTGICAGAIAFSGHYRDLARHSKQKIV